MNDERGPWRVVAGIRSSPAPPIGAQRAAELAQELEFMEGESAAAFQKAVDAIETEFEKVKAAIKRNA